MLKNTAQSYGSITKFLHWTIGIGIIGMLCVGFFMEEIEDLTTKIKVYGLHKSIGITILTLALARIVWHLYSKRPALVPGLKRWEIVAAHTLHLCLYAGMIAMPLSGWLLSSAAGRPVLFFGLFTLPDLVPADENLRNIFGTAHEIIAFCLVAGISVHVAAAMKHHFISKDKTLVRMLPGQQDKA